MANNKLITALKENKNDIRKKVLIVAGVTVAAVAAGVILTKLKDNTVDILIVSEDALTPIAEAVPTAE